MRIKHTVYKATSRPLCCDMRTRAGEDMLYAVPDGGEPSNKSSGTRYEFDVDHAHGAILVYARRWAPGGWATSNYVVRSIPMAGWRKAE